MQWSKIPYERLRAIDLGCSGFARTLAKCIQQGDEPDIQVIRVTPEIGKPHWFIEVRSGSNCRQMVVDMSRLETQAAVVPIYLGEHIQRIREELGEVVEMIGLDEAVKKVVPVGQIHRGAKLS
jgi:hypothetical protein